jgi:hypothetical protein
MAGNSNDHYVIFYGCFAIRIPSPYIWGKYGAAMGQIPYTLKYKQGKPIRIILGDD